MNRQLLNVVAGVGANMSCCENVVCEEICTALVVVNSWNIPACGQSAVLSVPGTYNVLIGSYIWNPTYGWFEVTQFDSLNRQITVMNECITNNGSPGTPVPANTMFVFGAPPGSTAITVSAEGLGIGPNLTTVNTPLAFAVQNPTIVIPQPGTYLLMGGVEVSNNLVQSSTIVTVSGGLRRLNNTPLDINPVNLDAFLPIVAPNALTLGYRNFVPSVYTTPNSNDQIGVAMYYTGTITSGNLNVFRAYVRAVKLY